MTFAIFGEEAIPRKKKSWEHGFRHGRTWITSDERVALLFSHGYQEEIEVIDEGLADRISGKDPEMEYRNV